MAMRRTTCPHISRILPTRRTVRTNSHMVIPLLDPIPPRLAVEVVEEVVVTGILIRTRDHDFRMRASRVSIHTTPIRTTRRHHRRCRLRLSSEEEDRIDMTTRLHIAPADTAVQVLGGLMVRFSHRLSDLPAFLHRGLRVQHHNLGTVQDGRIRSLVLVVARAAEGVHEDH